MTKLNGWKMAVVICLLCAATVIASHAQIFTKMASFEGTNGASPEASLVQGLDGNFYGTTDVGGEFTTCAPNRCGTVFEITPSGALITLYSFCAQVDCIDGAYSSAGLVQAVDGDFYGVAEYGGVDGIGTVFKITREGALTTLHSFAGYPTDGQYPVGVLIQAADGNFYGTTNVGGLGPSAGGTVFKITPGGTLTVLYTFCSQTNCTDGVYPVAGLTQATDTNFYGTTSNGGANVGSGCLGVGCGTIFRITSGGTLTTLYSSCAKTSCADGAAPYAGLIQARDGNFYGTTSSGGTNRLGTVFKITPAGALTTLHSFCIQPACDDGATPYAGLVQATDGNLYGTTLEGGAKGYGTVFKITPSGTLTTLYSFCPQTGCTDGVQPWGGLLQGTDGNFYGTTYHGGHVICSGGYGCGTVFSLSVGLRPFVAFVQAAARVGQTAEILGQGFTGATSVSFNGIPATFTVRRDTFLVATVPAGATTGYVTVTTPSGTLTSNVQFHVLP